jgi:poly-gamma-glutamate synthesis protein (capsule biosynthesis protein)
MNKFFKTAVIFISAFELYGCEKVEQTAYIPAETTETVTETVLETTEPYNPLVEIKFSFLGDCTLATQMGQNYEGSFNWYAENYDKEYFFEKTYPYVYDDDFTIANCENVFTDSALEERYKGYTPAFWFRSPSKNAEIFPAGNIEVVSIANNHTLDYSEDGMNDTIKAVEATGQLEWGGEEKDVILEKDDVKIGLVCDTMWSEIDTDKIIQRIENLNNSTDIQIVYFHGGEEAVHTEEYWKVQACHKMADAGADLIVGGHPHVLQPLETYNDVHIVYSIGNFCFGGNRYPENRTVIYQEVFSFNKDTKEIESRKENIIPFYVFTGDINNFQPAPIEDETISQQVLDFMYRKSSSLF